MDYDLKLILLDLLITFAFFMIGPFIRFHKKSHLYTVKEIQKFNILNSVIVQIIFMIIISITNDEPKFNFAPAFLYYFINQWLWTRKIKKNNVEQNNDKDDDIAVSEKSETSNDEEEISKDEETDVEEEKEETSDIMNLLNKK